MRTTKLLLKAVPALFDLAVKNRAVKLYFRGVDAEERELFEIRNSREEVLVPVGTKKEVLTALAGLEKKET